MMYLSLIIIYNHEGKILLQHRDSNAPTNPNKWGLWGGKAEEGEAPDHAAIRELFEELNITINKDSLTFFSSFILSVVNAESSIRAEVFTLKHQAKFKYKLQEGDDLKFFTEEEINKLETDSNAKTILNEFFTKSEIYNMFQHKK